MNFMDHVSVRMLLLICFCYGNLEFQISEREISRKEKSTKNLAKLKENSIAK